MEINLTRPQPFGRGCGERDEDAPYSCCGTSPNGMPLEHFMHDPVVSWEWDFHRGVDILPRTPGDPNSVNDMIVYVGAEAYPYYWDFAEETREYGASRKMSEDLPFWKLTPFISKMRFVHRFCLPWFRFEVDRDRPLAACKKWECFRQNPEWTHFAWHPCEEDIEPDHCTFAAKDLAFLFHKEERLTNPGMENWFEVEFASTRYNGIYPSSISTTEKKAKTVSWEPLARGFDKRQFTTSDWWGIGLFMSLPLTHFEFKNKAPQEIKEKIQQAGFEVADELGY